MQTEDDPITRRESALRWDAHAELHSAHERAHDQEHDMTEKALDKAVGAMDKRLEGMNEFRASLKDQSQTFARIDTVDALRERIVAIEKLDIKGEGRSLGQGAVVAVLVGAISLSATIVGIIVVLANLFST